MLYFWPRPKWRVPPKFWTKRGPNKIRKVVPNFRKNSANFWWWVSWCSFSHRETTRHQNFHEERHQNFERSEARKNSKNGARLAGKIWKNRDQFLEDILVVLFSGDVFGVSYRWAWDFLKIAKKYQWNLDSFQTHQQVTQKLQFQYQMHREAVQFVFFL